MQEECEEEETEEEIEEKDVGHQPEQPGTMAGNVLFVQHCVQTLLSAGSCITWQTLPLKPQQHKEALTGAESVPAVHIGSVPALTQSPLEQQHCFQISLASHVENASWA